MYKDSNQNTVAHIHIQLHSKFRGFVFKYKQLLNVSAIDVNLQGKAKGWICSSAFEF